MGRLRSPGRRLYRYHLYGYGIQTLSRYLRECNFQLLSFYRESSKNLAALDQKAWAKNPVIRAGISTLTVLGDVFQRQDGIVAIAQKTPI